MTRRENLGLSRHALLELYPTRYLKISSYIFISWNLNVRCNVLSGTSHTNILLYWSMALLPGQAGVNANPGYTLQMLEL